MNSECCLNNKTKEDPNTMKKLVSLLLSLALFLSLAGGALAESKPVELNFWYWDTSMDDTYAEMFKDFSANNPGITVKLTQLPWSDYWTKLQTALPTGTGPDIFWLNHPNAVTYLPTGLVSSLQPEIDKSAIDMKPFAESLYNPFKLDGQVYAVPIFFDTIAMAYNKTMLADAGYPDGPPADWTWDDLKEISKKLTKDGVHGLIVNASGQSHSMDYILQNGGSIFSEDGLTCTLDSDASVEAVKFMLDLMYVEKVTPTQSEQKELNGNESFQNGLAAMTPAGLWMMKPFMDSMGEGAFDVAPLPQNKQKGTIVHNLGYVLSAKANQEAGMKLMAYLASKDHGDRIAKVFAPAHSESQALWFAQFPNLNLKAYTDGLAYAKGLMIAKKNAGQVFGMYEEEMDRFFLNYKPEMDVKAELTKIAQTLTAEIAK